MKLKCKFNTTPKAAPSCSAILGHMPASPPSNNGSSKKLNINDENPIAYFGNKVYYLILLIKKIRVFNKTYISI